MKKLALLLMTASLLVLFTPGNLKAKRTDKALTTTTTVSSTETEARMARYNEIKSMDNSTLSASEKKDLRAESRSIKKDMKANGTYNGNGHGGLYVSVAAAILIVVLLVLLL